MQQNLDDFWSNETGKKFEENYADQALMEESRFRCEELQFKKN